MIAEIALAAGMLQSPSPGGYHPDVSQDQQHPDCGPRKEMLNYRCVPDGDPTTSTPVSGQDIGDWSVAGLALISLFFLA